MINWKTSLAGLALLLPGIGGVLSQLSTGHWDSASLSYDWGLIVGGIGLLFAKDMNVTGGTVPSTMEAASRVS